MSFHRGPEVIPGENQVFFDDRRGRWTVLFGDGRQESRVQFPNEAAARDAAGETNNKNTETVPKQLVKNKVKEKSIATESFKEETAELVEVRAANEGSTVGGEVGNEAAGFKSISAAVGKEPVTDGPVMTVMTNNIPGQNLEKNNTATTEITAITGKASANGVLDEVIVQGSPKGMTKALEKTVGIDKNKITSIVSKASSIPARQAKAVEIEQTGGISKFVGAQAATASAKVSIELGNPIGSNNLFGSIMSGKGNIIANLVSLAFGKAGIKSININTTLVDAGTQLLNNRNIKISPPPLVFSGGQSNLKNIVTKSSGGNPSWTSGSGTGERTPEQIFKVGKEDATWRGWQSEGMRPVESGGYHFKPLITYDHIEAELRHAVKEREITTLIFNWTGFGTGMDMLTAGFIHEAIKKKQLKDIGAAEINANPLNYGFQIHCYVQSKGFAQKVVPWTRGLHTDKSPELNPMLAKTLYVMINAGSTLSQDEVSERKEDVSIYSESSISKDQWEVMDEFIKAFMTVCPGGEILGRRDIEPSVTVANSIAPGFDVRAYTARKFTKDSTFKEDKIPVAKASISASELADREPATIKQSQAPHDKVPKVNNIVKASTPAPTRESLQAAAGTFAKDNEGLLTNLRRRADAAGATGNLASGISNAATAVVDTAIAAQTKLTLGNKFEAMKQGLKFDKISNLFKRQE